MHEKLEAYCKEFAVDVSEVEIQKQTLGTTYIPTAARTEFKFLLLDSREYGFSLSSAILHHEEFDLNNHINNEFARLGVVPKALLLYREYHY